MKKVLLLVVLVVAAWYGIQATRTFDLDGKVVSPDQTVFQHPLGTPFSVADRLEEGRWTLVLFMTSQVNDQLRLQRDLEVGARRLGTVKLVVVDVGTTSSQVAEANRVEELPLLRLYDGFRQVSEDREKILRSILGE